MARTQDREKPRPTASTDRAYEADWTRHQVWCRDAGWAALPAAPAAPSSATKPRGAVAALVLASVLVAGAARAAVDCPATLGKHYLARTGFASLYQGDPSHMDELAPSREATTATGVNVWDLSNSAGLVLVCQYEGTRQTVRLDLGPGLHTCRQSIRPPTFSCR